MSSLNKVTLIGNLGRNPDSRQTSSGGKVVNLNIATSESWHDKNTGEKVEHTEWHKVVMFNKLAEIAEKYLKMGSKIYIEGKLSTRKWTDNKTGQDRHRTEIVSDRMIMLGGGKSNTEDKIVSLEEAENFSKEFFSEDIPF